MTAPRKPVSKTASDAPIVALHCSLSSGRQWTPFVDGLSRFQIVTPDLYGYGARPRLVGAPETLQTEIDALQGTLAAIPGAFHLVGHSYGGAIAFKIATSPRYAARVQSLTLIEPILPTVLVEPSDQQLFGHFARLAQDVSEHLSNGAKEHALARFVDFWNGPDAWKNSSENARMRMMAHAGMLAVNFTAAFSEDGVTQAARTIHVPTKLVRGSRSPDVTRLIVDRLATLIDGAHIVDMPDAGHMLAITHAADLIPEIGEHVAHAGTRSVERTSGFA